MKLRILSLIALVNSSLYVHAQIPDLIPYFKDGQYGYCDPAGGIVIQPAYRNAFFFKGQHAIAETGFKDSARKVIIDRKGKVIYNNSERKAISLLPCGKYFTVRNKDKLADRQLLYTVNGQLLHTFAENGLTIEFVLDSVIFYSDSTGEKGFGNNIFDLSGKRSVPAPFLKTKYHMVSDSLVVAYDDTNFSHIKLIKVKDHTFRLHEGFTGYEITDMIESFVVFKDKNNRYGIADDNGKVMVQPVYRQIRSERPVEQKDYRPADPSWDSYFICGDVPALKYRIKNKTLEKMEQVRNDLPFTLESAGRNSGYRLNFRNGRSTEAVFTSHADYPDASACIMAEYRSDPSRKNIRSFRMMDTTGQTVLDSFNGMYCGRGIYIIHGKNGRWAFWKNGKYISPFVFNSYVYNPGSFTLVPPVNKVLEGGMITVAMNQGNNSFGLMGEDGKEILPPIFHYIKPLGNGLYFVSGYKGIFYCNASGQIYATGIGI